eukprot:evm.model.NODE_14319_length_7238_cov_33.526665.2
MPLCTAVLLLKLMWRLESAGGGVVVCVSGGGGFGHPPFVLMLFPLSPRV